MTVAIEGIFHVRADNTATKPCRFGGGRRLVVAFGRTRKYVWLIEPSTLIVDRVPVATLDDATRAAGARPRKLATIMDRRRRVLRRNGCPLPRRTKPETVKHLVDALRSAA